MQALLLVTIMGIFLDGALYKQDSYCISTRPRIFKRFDSNITSRIIYSAITTFRNAAKPQHLIFHEQLK